VTRTHMVYVLPFCPWFSLGFRVFVPRTTWFPVDGNQACPLRHFLTTSAVFPEACCQLSNPRPTLNSKFSSSLRSASLQHSQHGRPFFALNLRLSVWRLLPLSPKVPPLGFGYPFDGVSSPKPWKSFSTPHAHGIRPSELFSVPEIRLGFRSDVPLLRFSPRPFGLGDTLQRLKPSGSAVPFSSQMGLASRSGHMLSWAFVPFRLPSDDPTKKLLPFSSPSRPFDLSSPKK